MINVYKTVCKKLIPEIKKGPPYVNEFCNLCLSPIAEDATRIEDEVVVESQQNCLRTMDISDIMLYLVGADFSDVSAFETVCGNCTKSAIQSYKFLVMCKENLENLYQAVDTLTDCFENTDNEVDKFNSLFITINSDDSTIKQYYDTQQPVRTPSSALKRLRSFTNVKPERRKLLNEMKEKKTKGPRKVSADLYDICDLIREKNCPTKFKCKVCSNVFLKSFNFKKHYYSQHGEKTHKCDHCPRSYGSETLLKQHVYDCHSNMVCTECGKAYKNRYSLLYHMRLHTGETPYECNVCGQKFQWSSRRAEHIRRFHMEPTIECNVCHIKLKSLSSLYSHRKRHFNFNSRLYVGSKDIEIEECEIDGTYDDIEIETTE